MFPPGFVSCLFASPSLLTEATARCEQKWRVLAILPLLLFDVCDDLVFCGFRQLVGYVMPSIEGSARHWVRRGVKLVDQWVSSNGWLNNCAVSSHVTRVCVVLVLLRHDLSPIFYASSASSQ